jgi:hypothetical protein
LKRIGKFFLFLTLFVSTQVFGADVHFNATVDRNELTQNDNVTLTLTLSSDGNISGEEDPRLPSLDGFELLNKWSQSESSSVFDNGQFKFQRKIVYRYSLSPQKAGTLLIGPAEIRVGGQTLRSQPIKVVVSVAGNQQPNSKITKNQNQPPSQNDFGEDDDENDLFTQLLRRRGLGVPGQPGGPMGRTAPPPSTNSEDVNAKDVFFIGVEVNKKKAYVGEEIVATWYLYTRTNLQGFDALKYPELKGFWKEDLDMATRLSFHPEIVNGIPYNKALLVSYALFPISPGKKVIDSYEAKGTVIQMDSPMAMFGLGSPMNVTKSSKEVPFDVLPLPTAGQPASFSGAVGKFSVTGSLSSTQVKANQPVSLKIRFTGEGNVKAIELPPIDLPKDLELYDTKKDSKFEKNGQGYKEFELMIVPRAPGDVTIPPIAVSYFDPGPEKYVSTQTPSFQLKVLPGDPTNPNNLVPTGKIEGEAPKAAAPDIRYLKTIGEFALPPQEEKILWIIAFLTVYLSFGFQIWRVFSGSDTNSAAEIKRRVKKKLLAARALLKAKDFRGAGVECSNAVLSTLGEAAGGGGATPSEELLTRLPKGTEKLQEAVRKFLNQCEVLSFAPDELTAQGIRSEGEVKKIISEAEKIIEKLLQANKKERVSSKTEPQALSEEN